MSNLSLYQKLSLIQSSLKAPKSNYNSFGKYKYRSCGDILGAVKGLLKEYSVAITLSDSVFISGDRVYIEATASISDGTTVISSKAYAREPLAKKGMDESQITGSASSYARKYALAGLLAIDDEADADSINKHDDKEEFRFKGGKYKDKSLEEIDPTELRAYADWMEQTDKNKFAFAIDIIDQYLKRSY